MEWSKSTEAKFQIHFCMSYDSSILNIECLCFSGAKGAKDVAAYCNDRTLNGFPVIPTSVSSDGRKCDVFKSASEIQKFISSSLENIKQPRQAT